ncbi:uncharacterized protein topaz1 isoform X2 [Nerophis ophidion]|uniref:uncharacterized protein topaz1 isoform X2 n=1 Tax=Nerophis ophidion TaxID=159077 RepID=UPI002ADF2176|nr:uncharacterized protein topaz1 isoform X2 [Nerophis ophidion]
MSPSSNRLRLNRSRIKHVACVKAARRTAGRQAPVDVDAEANNGGYLSRGSRVERRGLTDVDGTVNSISTSFAGSEVSLKRRSQASTCTICGHSKCISPQRRTQVKLVAKSFDLCPEKTSREDVRLGRHPKVTLCDVVRNCRVKWDRSRFLLPDVLRTETVYCFKQDMRVAGFQSSPRCDQRQNTTVPYLRMRLSGNRRQPVENTKKESGINSTASRFSNGRDSDVSKTSFWFGKAGQSSGGNVRTKRQDLDNILKEVQKCSQSCPEPTLRKDNGVPEEPCPKKVAQETPELFSDDQATFTCQRVRVHIRREHYSCARTDKAWPFADNGPALLKLPADRQRLSPQHHQPLGSLGRQSSDIHHEADLTEGVGHKSSHETENNSLHAKKLTVGLPAVTTTSFTASQQSDSGTDLLSVGPSSSTHSPSELGLRGSLTDRPVFALSPIPKAVWSPTSSPSASISQGSQQSSFLLHQEIGTHDSSPPLNYELPPAIDKWDEEYMENTQSEFVLPPVLSPFNSPKGNFSSQNISLDKDVMNTLLPRVFINGLINLGKGNQLDVVSSDLGSLPDHLARETQASPCSVGDVDNRTHVETNEARGTPEKPPSDQTPDRDHSTTELRSPLSTWNGDRGGEPNKEQPPSSVAARPCVLDELTAYQHDILLVDVNHDESELFEDLPQESLLKLGPVRVQVNQVTSRAPQTMKPRWTPVNIKFPCGSPDVHEESISRPWRPQNGNNICPKSQKDTSFVTDRQTRPMGKYEAYKNRINGGQERQQPIQNQSHNPIPHLCTWKNGPWMPKSANKRDIGCKKTASYCRLFFSESESCGFKVCRFLHVPKEGDEKGRRVVEVLSLSKVSYSMLKGLFGNEDGGSRCSLITMATELFLLSGSLEGALNTLRENQWFLSSSLWPCPPAHLESRSRVLIHLAERSSHRDKLEVLSNLPGIQEPSDQVEVLRYTGLFNSHLQVCVDRHVLPVASDMVDFMLRKKLLVDYAVLQRLIQKLAKQNHWLRARQVFKHSLTAGYYPAISAPPGLMALMVPSQLVEEEVALAYEMFIAVNAYAVLPLSEITPSTLSITLKRTQESESDYLLAGSRLLAAACLLQPKLLLHYTAVNSSQEQVFTLSLASAQRWLHNNQAWANQVWT